MDGSTPGFPVHHQLKLMSIESLIPSNHPSSVVPFSSCLQSFPGSGSFPMSQFFASGGQNIGASTSVSVLPMNIKDWFPFGWTGLISLQWKGLSRVFSSVGDLGLIPGLGRTPGQGQDYPLQYSGLENYSPWGCKESDTTEWLSLLSFTVPIFAWHFPAVSPIFLKKSLVFDILLFSSISLHCSLKKAFLSLLVILLAFCWVYLSLSPFAFHFSSFLNYL